MVLGKNLTGKVDEYRQWAASLLDLAQRTDSLPDKNRLLIMVKAWLDLADRAAKPNAADYLLVRTRLGGGSLSADGFCPLSMPLTTRSEDAPCIRAIIDCLRVRLIS
jgi:hypothetical protein